MIANRNVVIIVVIPLKMAFTLRHLLLFMFAVSVAMLLATRCHPALALLITIGLASPLVFLLPMRMRRAFFYGGIAGVLLGFALTFVVLNLYYINSPRERIIYGPRVGQLQYSRAQRDAQKMLNPYIVSLGYILGATAGLLVSNKFVPKAQPIEPDSKT